MKVCAVVMDSIWYDPRVMKQIKEYKKHVDEVIAIGCYDYKYDISKIEEIPCKTYIIGTNYKYSNSLLDRFKNYIKRKKDIKKILKYVNPDIIHANDLSALKVCYSVSKKIKCKLIYDSHEICVENIGLKGIRKFIESKF